MNKNLNLYIPVILGTTRNGRASEYVAKFITQQISSREDADTETIDIAKLNISTESAGEELKDNEFSKKMARSDAIVIVAPEYNHGYPGYLKHILDTNLKEYIHKAVGICGVSAGPFGGTRVIQNLLPVMRELGLVNIFWDVNFSMVQNVFNSEGQLQDQSYIRRTEKFLKELVWMAKVLKYGRDNVSIE